MLHELEYYFFELMNNGFAILVNFIVLFVVIHLIIGKRKKDLFSHWNTLIDGLNYSTQETYERIESNLKERNITGVSFKRQKKLTGNMFSVRRQYLVIDWREFRYEICASPFADSFFVSYWLSIRQSRFKSFIARIPLLGWVIAKLFFRTTYYTIDTSNMFQSLVHEAITSVVDEIFKENNIQPLTESEKIPEMKDVFKR